MMISMPAAIAATSATLRPSTQKSSARSGEYSRQAERRVGEPAGVGHELEQRAAVVEEPAHQVREEAVGAEAGEGHLPGAEQERQQQDGEALGDRQDDQEHRHRAVVGEQLVVELGADEVVLRHGQLQAHHQRVDAAAEQQEEEAGEQQALADGVVLDRHQLARAGPAGRPTGASHLLRGRPGRVSTDGVSTAGVVSSGRRSLAAPPGRRRGRASSSSVSSGARHGRARLDLVRVAQPLGQVARACWRRVGGERRGGWRRG